VVGDVTMGEGCSIWFNAVVRGDVNFIRIGNEVNIQDGAVIHGTYQKHGTTIGNHVSIGHGATVHGCTLHDQVLIGMGAIVMDRCVVESGSIVAAGAVWGSGQKSQGHHPGTYGWRGRAHRQKLRNLCIVAASGRKRPRALSTSNDYGIPTLLPPPQPLRIGDYLALFCGGRNSDLEGLRAHLPHLHLDPGG
jgi:carbonic anhydrase/acetyltransferase-like protein (isoleucine patch superfamily)